MDKLPVYHPDSPIAVTRRKRCLSVCAFCWALLLHTAAMGVVWGLTDGEAPFCGTVSANTLYISSFVVEEEKKGAFSAGAVGDQCGAQSASVRSQSICNTDREETKKTSEVSGLRKNSAENVHQNSREPFIKPAPDRNLKSSSVYAMKGTEEQTERHGYYRGVSDITTSIGGNEKNTGSVQALIGSDCGSKLSGAHNTGLIGSAEYEGGQSGIGHNNAETPVPFGEQIGPAFKRFTMPQYPLDARRRGIEGRVEICVNISEQGKIESARIICSPHRSLTRAALSALRRAEFYPYAPQGRARRCITIIPIRFRLG